MARRATEIRELTERIEALPVDQQAKLLEVVMTPQMRLRLLVAGVRRRGSVKDERRIDRVVDGAVKRIRRAAGSR